VERVGVTRRGRAGPVPGGRWGVPRLHADHHPRPPLIRSSAKKSAVMWSKT